jgi:hypothetical protein
MSTWVHYEEPSDDDSQELVNLIETALRYPLHRVTERNLKRRRTAFSHAIARRESHYDRYLFGQLHLPIAIGDGARFARRSLFWNRPGVRTPGRVALSRHASIQMSNVWSAAVHSSTDNKIGGNHE